MPDRATRRRRPFAVGVSGLVVVAVAAGLIVWTTSASGSSGYRTARVTDATVRQTLGISGTVAPVHEGVAAFQVAGTIAKVDVSTGGRVKAGQILASLDPTTLRQDVTATQAALTAARAALTENEAGEASTSGSATPSTSAVVSGSTTVPIVEDAAIVTKPPPGSHKPPGKGGTTKKGSTSGVSLKQAQAAVVRAQQNADADSAVASAALARAQATCSGAAPKPTTGSTGPTPPTGGTTTTTVPVSGGPTHAGSTTSTTSTTAGSTTSTTSTVPTSTVPTSIVPTSTPPTTVAPTPTTGPASSESSACAAALTHALADQQQVATDQRTVASAESTLAQVLSASAAKAASTGTKGASGGSSKTGTGTATGAGTSRTSTASGSSGSSSVAAANDSAQQLASDQSAIDSDEASVIQAQQAVADAELRSPIAGTVAAVGIVAGQAVTAGSPTAAITVLNSGSFEAMASLTSAQVAHVKVGDAAVVTVDGMSTPLGATVARVGPVDTTSTSYAYPLVVALSAGSHGISSGATAQIQVVLDQVTGTLAVPTSAVHTTGVDDSYVLVWRSGREIRTKVSIGAVGGVYTQIRSGVTLGTSVVLADLSEAIPASSTNATTGRLGGGGLGGGGFAAARTAAGGA